MENTFPLNVNGVEYQIRVFEAHQFEVSGKDNRFIIHHEINNEGNDVFVLAEKGEDLGVTQELIKAIGDKIDSHYL